MYAVIFQNDATGTVDRFASVGSLDLAQRIAATFLTAPEEDWEVSHEIVCDHFSRDPDPIDDSDYGDWEIMGQVSISRRHWYGARESATVRILNVARIQANI